MEEYFDEERGWEGEIADGELDGGEESVENPQEVLCECLEKFSTPDYIMEPGIFTQLKRYFQAGGVKVTDVQAMVENHLKEMIVKTFDPKKADTIFTEEGELISDAGYQGEITSISTAAQQIEVFSRVLKTAISGFLQNSDDWQNNIQECAKMVCHGQHTYVYSQVLLQVLSHEPKGGATMKRLSQEITKFITM
uniref:Uncharacterized protein n=2 Tax=Timema TaxID=61471 RepID=A0A7R9IGG9_9NEOP|nr:unnamed protein product [Timema bartmani]CAD7457957.1 unnamed protein product [Timema tahoe]